ncbi:MAG: ECF transporter S component [Clostridia bacterium]|nr:ECF transporter S component [Clostridia bacterium]
MKYSKKAGSFSATYRLVLMAVLVAFLLLLAFTPLGFALRIGPVSITFLCIPVIVAACMLGPGAGAVLGGIFGLLSMYQAFSGMDPFGAALVQAQPVYTVLVCLIPRILCGFLAGLCYKLLMKVKCPVPVSAGISGFVCSITNTLFFCGSIAFLFNHVPFAGGKVGALIVAAGLTNGIPEAIAAVILGSAICTALHTFMKKR